MVCWSCLSFNKSTSVCKDKPGEEIPIQNPKENWCGSGTWREGTDILPWGYWKFLDETLAEGFQMAWRDLKSYMDRKDDEYISIYAERVISRANAIDYDDILDVLGEEEAKLYFAWKSVFFGKAPDVDLNEAKERAEEWD